MTGALPVKIAGTDCAVRALAWAKGWTWLQAYRELCRVGCVPTTTGTVLTQAGMARLGFRADFIDPVPLTVVVGTAIVGVPGHWIGVRHGVIDPAERRWIGAPVDWLATA